MRRSIVAILTICMIAGKILAQTGVPKLVLPAGHFKPIKTVLFSPDGKFVLSSGDDGMVKSWEVATGKEMNEFKGADAGVSVLRFSPGKKVLLAGCNDGKVVLWEYETQKLLKVMHPHNKAITAVDYFSDSQFLLGSVDGTAIVYDIDKDRVLATARDNNYSISTVAYFPQGEFFMTGGTVKAGQSVTTLKTDSPAKLWNMRGEQQKTFGNGMLRELTKFSSNDVNLVAFSPDSRYAFAGDRGQGRIYDLMTGKTSAKKTIREDVDYGKLTADGKMLVLGKDDEVKFVSFPDGELIRTTKLNLTEITSLDVSPDGAYLVVGTMNRKAIIVDALSGTQIMTLMGRSGGIMSVTFSPYGRYLATGSMDASTKIWDIENGKLFRVIKGGGQYAVSSLAFSPDNKRIAVGSSGDSSKLYDIESGTEVYRFNGGSGSLTFSPDGKQLLAINRANLNPLGISLGFWHKATMFVYDTETGKEKLDLSRTVLGGSSNRVNFCATISANGEFVYVGGKEEYSKSGKTGSILDNVLGAGKKTTVSTQAAETVTKGELHVWNMQTGKFIQKLPEPHGELITAIDVSPDGKYIVTACSDKTVYFWNRILGRQTKKYDLHEGAISSVCYSRDGKYVLTAGYDKTAQLIDVEADKRVLTLKGHTAELFAARFSPDSKYIVTAGWDNTTRLWNRETGKELATLIPIDMDEWLIVTPEGYFDGSDKALQTLYYAYQSYTFPLQQLKDKYYKKELLPILLGYKEGKLPETHAFSVADLYPVVKLDEKINAQNPVLNIHVTNLGGGVGKVKVVINGKTAFEDVRTTQKDKKTTGGEVVHIPVKLASSKLIQWGTKNTIEVTAWNGENSLSAPAETISFEASKSIK